MTKALRVNHLFLSRNILSNWKTSGKKFFSLLVFPLQKNFTLITPLILIALHLCSFKWIIISVNRTEWLNLSGCPAAGVSRDAERISGDTQQEWSEMEPAQPPEQAALGENMTRQHGAATPRCSHGFLALPVLCKKKKAKEQMWPD